MENAEGKQPEKYEYKNALEKLRRLCSKAEKCRKDICEKLNTWAINREEGECIMNQLEKEGFISEQRYAFSFASEKFRINKWGRLKIAFALQEKEIPESLITKALLDIDNNEYLDTVNKELFRKSRMTAAKNDIEMKDKLLQFALSRGYEEDLAIRVMEEMGFVF